MTLSSLATFYELSTTEVQTLTFPNNKAAIKYRLRLYNHRRSHKHLPKLTITLDGCTIKAGPEGWDLMEAMELASPETVQKMKELEKAEDERMEKLFNEMDKEKNKLREASDNALAAMGFGKKKENPYE